jgi:hypothetical protein
MTARASATAVWREVTWEKMEGKKKEKKKTRWVRVR